MIRGKRAKMEVSMETRLGNLLPLPGNLLPPAPSILIVAEMITNACKKDLFKKAANVGLNMRGSRNRSAFYVHGASSCKVLSATAVLGEEIVLGPTSKKLR